MLQAWMSSEAFREWDESADIVAHLRGELGELAAGRCDDGAFREREAWKAAKKAVTAREDPAAYESLEEEEAEFTYAERKPILFSGQHALIGNYGTAPLNKRQDLQCLRGRSHTASQLAQQLRDMPKEYVVEDGDTLSGVALRLDYTERELRRYNKLSSATIYQGQRLLLPPPRPLRANEKQQMQRSVSAQNRALQRRKPTSTIMPLVVWNGGKVRPNRHEQSQRPNASIQSQRPNAAMNGICTGQDSYHKL